MKPLLLALAAAGMMPAQTGPLLTPDELAGDWKISRDFTLEVAEKMPAEFYGFKPAPEVMSFGEQMIHLAGSAVYRFHQLTGSPVPAGKPPDSKDKTAVVNFVRGCFDYVIAVLPKVTPAQMTRTMQVDWPGRPEVNGRQMMMNMFTHIAHHRGQCEVYLRLKNIAPPVYRF